MTRLVYVLVFLFCASAAKAVTCENVTFSQSSFTVCAVNASEDLRLFHADAAGKIYGGFTAIENDVGPLVFAMNAGMYHDDRSPVGLFQEDGDVKRSIVFSAGPGNFGMLPNGVLCISDNAVGVIESSNYETSSNLGRCL